MYAWARVYVDDIICRAKSLPDLVQKLRILFNIFLDYNILIKSIESYLNYFDIGLLGLRMNFLGLTTSVDKLKAIQLLMYSNTLSVLKYYLGLTSYFYNYIYFYTHLAVIFQALKASLLRDALVSS